MKDIIQAMFENYPRFSECTLQTFDDNKERKSASLARKFINKEENYTELEELNKKGAGIFFSVNPMLPGKRDKESVVGVSSWICEIDGLDKETQKKLISNCPLKPNLILESNSSYHLYWFAKDGKLENRPKICNGLRNYFDGDPAIPNDTARVLRLPGFNHMKDENKPFEITLFDFMIGDNTEEQMLSAYPNTLSVSEIKQSLIIKEDQARKAIGGDYYWDRVKNMDTKTMLEEISGSQWVDGQIITFRKNTNGTEQIRVNGKSTGSWIDKNGKIGSSAGGGPNWTNWVFWYNKCDGKELSRWINDKHPEMVIDKTIPKKEVKVVDKEIKEDIDFSTITPFSRGLQVLDERFGRFELNKLIVTIGESQSGKTEFTFFQARVNADRGYKTCYIALEMNKKNMILRICQKSAGVTKIQRDNKTFTDQQKQIMKNKYDELWNYKNLDIIYITKPTIEDIKETIKEKQKEGYELFYIDNLGFIIGDIPEIELTSMVIRELKDITNTQPLSINLLHHFNKGGTKDRIGPRGMASIRSSGKIENDADYVVQVWRDLDEDIPPEDKKIVGIYLQKDRVWGDPSYCKIEFDRGNYIPRIEQKPPF